MPPWRGSRTSSPQERSSVRPAAIRSAAAGPAGATVATTSPATSVARAQQRAAGLPRTQHLALAATQPGGAEPDDQLARADRHRPGRDHPVVPLGRHVVVVPVEAPRRNAEAERERVQLVERRVAGQVRPEPAVTRRVGRVDEDRHPPAGPVRRWARALA